MIVITMQITFVQILSYLTLFRIWHSGFPLWLHFIPGVQLRTDNEPYKVLYPHPYSSFIKCGILIYHITVYNNNIMFQIEMQRFTTYIVNLMKQEKLYASQGGPIILSQVILALHLLFICDLGVIKI